MEPGTDIDDGIRSVAAAVAVIRAHRSRLRVLEVRSANGTLADSVPRAEIDVATVDAVVGQPDPADAVSYDCAVACDILGELDADLRRRLLQALWRRSHAVIVSAQLGAGEAGELEDASAFLAEAGAEVTVVPAAQIPVVAAVRALGRMREGGRPEQVFEGSGFGSLGAMLDLSLESRRGVLVAANGQASSSLDLSGVQWYERESRGGADAASLAVLPLSLELGRLGTRLARTHEEIRERDAALARRDAEVRDLSAKLAALVETASADRVARRAAEARLGAELSRRRMPLGGRLATARGRWIVRSHRLRAKLRIRTRLRSAARALTGGGKDSPPG